VNWITHLFLTVTGSDAESGSVYGFWSGFGGSVPDFLILGSIAGYLLHRNCHVQRCWRLGRHHVEGTPYVTCRRHHPAISGPVTAEAVASAHARSRP
jgi:hypothetical protein